MEKNKRLDIFKILRQIDNKDKTIYDSLKEEEQKLFQPFVVSRWLSSTNDERQIILLNEIVNPYVFNLSNHKGLLLKLMTACTSGRNKRYKYVKYSPKKAAKYPKALIVVKEYYKYSTMRANDVMYLISNSDIIEMADSMGYQDSEIKALKKEIKKR